MEKQTNKLPVARRQQILAWLEDEPMLSIQELQNRLNVSHMTIHRDLDMMAEQHLVRKVRGGIMHVVDNKDLSPRHNRCAMCGSRVSARTEVIIKKQDGSRVFACCAHCGIMLMVNSDDVESALAREYLYGRMVNIYQASYLVGSTVRLCCIPSTLCFASDEDAERFQRGFEGKTKNYSEVLNYLTSTHHNQ